MLLKYNLSNRHRLNRTEKRLGGFQMISAYAQVDYPAQGSVPHRIIGNFQRSVHRCLGRAFVSFLFDRATKTITYNPGYLGGSIAETAYFSYGLDVASQFIFLGVPRIWRSAPTSAKPTHCSFQFGFPSHYLNPADKHRGHS